MNELIKVDIEYASPFPVDARSLHQFLGSGQEFTTWIKSRIREYGFVAGQDFMTALSKTPNGGRPRMEYGLTLSMAKEVSMVERTEMGREARRYFLQCEERAKDIDAERRVSAARRTERARVINAAGKIRLLPHEIVPLREQNRKATRAAVKRLLADGHDIDVINFAIHGPVALPPGGRSLEIGAANRQMLKRPPAPGITPPEEWPNRQEELSL